MIVQNKYNVDRGKDCMKKFCESFREHVMKIINLKKKKMINKWTAGITWKDKNLHLQKTFRTEINALLIKNI